MGLYFSPLYQQPEADRWLRPHLGIRAGHSWRPAIYVIFCSACRLQVLTRFLGSSSPILYWFSAHLLQEYEPLLWSEGTDDQIAALRSEKSLLGKPPGSCGKETSENPLVRLLMNCSLIKPLSKCVLAFFLSYWLLGLILHCNFLPWT